MGIFSKLFRKNEDTHRVGGMEDFMTLIRVYYQSVMAANLGISNLAMLPDLRVFKQTMHVQTVNNKLGVGERKRCATMLQDMYGMSDTFFKEIDASIKKNCRNIQNVQPYFYQFQGFNQDMMMLVSNLMQWKLRMPSIFKNAIRTMTEKTVHDILTKADWSDDATRKTVFAVRKYQQTLGYSEAWITEYITRIVLLAKKEKQPHVEEK